MVAPLLKRVLGSALSGAASVGPNESGGSLGGRVNRGTRAVIRAFADCESESARTGRAEVAQDEFFALAESPGDVCVDTRRAERFRAVRLVDSDNGELHWCNSFPAAMRRDVDGIASDAQTSSCPDARTHD
jgi:hypothetical protein